MNNEIKPKRMNKRNKKAVIIIFAACILIAVCYFILNNTEIFAKNKKNTPTSMYSDKLYSYVFYPTDFDLDVTQNETYMGLDRQIYYKKGSVSYGISESDAELSNAVKFFIEYFKTVIAGDTETYNTFFTENYYKSNKPYVQFAPQMLYNIEIEELSYTTNDDGTTVYAFNVTYMIYRNDGTFRNDIDSDASKTLYYELIEDAAGDVKIDRITYYK